MNVLGFNIGHNGTACLLRDGKIIACVSEERFSGIKNHRGFPRRAVAWMLKENGLSGPDVDVAVFPSTVAPLTQAALSAGERKSRRVAAQEWAYRNVGACFHSLPGGDRLYRTLYDHVYWPLRNTRPYNFKSMFEDFGGPPKRCVALDHHTAHAYSSLFGVAPRGPDSWPLPALVLTCDGEGDLLSASVSRWTGNSLDRQAGTPHHDSLGLLYSAVTEYMGMRPLEHEYKIMGMAPYVSEEWVQRGARIFREILARDGLVFRSSVPSRMFLAELDGRLKRVRFDAIAGGIQRLTEELLTSWIAEACSRAGLRNVTAAGGVFMNVKANGKIAAMPEVDYLTVCPSAADESLAIGCAYYGFLKVNPERAPEPLQHLYLGIDCGRKEAESAIASCKRGGFRVEDVEGREPEAVAGLLLQGKIVGRCVGRCEFGARALGNRSILARPDRPELVRELNEQIKNRDFWMPFAGTVLKRCADSYLKDSKKSLGSHMMIAYDTAPDVRPGVSAASHPYDFTMRPQILEPSENPAYAAIIQALAEHTGVGAILNTSLNLHGFPMAGGAEDALKTFLDSGLQHIVIGPLLLSKATG